MKYHSPLFSSHKFVLSIILIFSILSVSWSVFPPPAIAITYDDAIQKGRALVDDGKFDEAQRIASSAVKQNSKRWEAYALLGLICHSQGDNTKAVASVDKALARAPEDKKATLLDMKEQFRQAKSSSTAASRASSNPKQKPDTPSLETTLQFIKEKIMEYPEVKYTFNSYLGYSNENHTFEEKRIYSSVTTDPSQCTLSYQVNHAKELSARTILFPKIVKTEVIKAVDLRTREWAQSGLPKWVGLSTRPEIYIVVVNERGGVEHQLAFEDLDTATRVSKAINYAIKICSDDKGKSPF